MANQSYLKDRLGFDPDDFMSEVDELFNNGPEDDDLVSPSHKKFKSFKPSPSPSSSTSSMKEYELKLTDIKGKSEHKEEAKITSSCVMKCLPAQRTCPS
jgi:hypothetical protein